MPINILERNLNKRMSLLLKDGRMLEGVLIGFDEYMNMVLDDTQETKDETVKKMGKVILRGNNVVTIVPV
jgi:small nuclear ribonucleoprotein